MLCIRQVTHLARALDESVQRLLEILQNPNSYYQELILHDPAKPTKVRTVVNVCGDLRALQQRLYRRVLLPKLEPSVHSHGGVKGRHIKSNALPHLASNFVFKTDVSDFYPSIHYRRVYDLFVGDLQCSPDVSRLCTKIATFRHHLALGLITSPILADRLMQPVDRRIGIACERAGLVYTRFVDDLTISGPFDLEQSGFARLVESILRENGFGVNPTKHQFGRISEGITITNLRNNRGHLDVRREYVDELERQMDDAFCLARGEAFLGPYYTSIQIRGRVQFVCWVNPGRRDSLLRKYRSIPWAQVEAEAKKRGLIESKKTLSRVEFDHEKEK
jgi:RNA-directed DNA polymerase